ncbi:DUF2637 domain-containing protein [Streptomyces coacervatus]|uniref:DUF2637 domain-containing protein n=1 Tax=Streptomyces coacervatus TaxID=647381 RepID=A0ABP7JHR4_9ACTN|nr:DUF2637 domain-containing protein [Streptomyces coacervatus]MDF2271074.1 DUF2637 domain-containing protein [Streptomyces coacervatus]
MNDEYLDLSFTPHERYPGDRYPSDRYPGDYNTGLATGRHRGPSDDMYSAGPLVEGWDPVEELTSLLQNAVTAEQTGTVSPPGREPRSPDLDFTGESMDNLAKITAELPPIRRRTVRHRKVRFRFRLRFTWLQTVSFLIAALAAVIVSMVSVFGGMVAYAPLRHVASATQGGMLTWWPLLVYGPWMVASLSILRSALHQRRALHSWFVVLLFSFLAMSLCVAEADRSFTGVAAAALPTLASLACFQQLVRQITLTRPPRKTISRHRHRNTPTTAKSPATATRSSSAASRSGSATPRSGSATSKPRTA